LALFLISWPAAHAQTTTSIDVTFAPLYQSTAALQFDVQLPGNVHVLSASPGPSTAAAGKSVFTADLQAGSKRILIVGLNRNVIGAGVVATLSIQVDAGSGPVVSPITIQNVVAADPAGSTAPVSGYSGDALTFAQTTPCTLQANSAVFVDATAQTLHFGNCSLPVFSTGGWLSTGLAANGDLIVTVAANDSGGPRSATLSAGAASVTVTQRQTASVFSDVPPSYDFFDAINLLWGRSITSGCRSAPLSYCPEVSLTRYEMAVLLVRAAMRGDNFTYSAAPYFADVPSTHPYFKWIQKMKELGITLGCDAAHYCPDSLVTRGQMAAFIIRARYGISTAYGYPSAPYFTDVPPGDGFYAPVQKMRQVGITSGCAPTLYCPTLAITRGQVAVFVMRGEFNQLLPANTPVITTVTPASAAPGQSVNVTITGRNTSFIDGTTRISAGAGITLSSIHVVNSDTIIALALVAGDAASGPRSILIETGAEEAVLPNGFRVQ
jgi:hypothetical protein